MSSMYEFLRKVNSVLFYDNYFTRRKMYKKFSKGVKIKPLTLKQKKEAHDYWHKLLNRSISTKWHELFYSITGVFTPRYLPLDLHKDLIANANIPNTIMSFIDDKNLNKYFLRDFKTPQRVLECCNGVYYLPELGYKEVSRQTAQEYCRNLSDCIIKPSKASSAGIGVQLFDYKLITNEGVQE